MKKKIDFIILQLKMKSQSKKNLEHYKKIFMIEKENKKKIILNLK